MKGEILDFENIIALVSGTGANAFLATAGMFAAYQIGRKFLTDELEKNLINRIVYDTVIELRDQGFLVLEKNTDGELTLVSISSLLREKGKDETL